MGPTYLVLLRGGAAALVLYDGTDEIEALRTFDKAYAEHRAQPQPIDGKCGVYLVTVRSEAKLP